MVYVYLFVYCVLLFFGRVGCFVLRVGRLYYDIVKHLPISEPQVYRWCDFTCTMKFRVSTGVLCF